ncbi:type I-E CRISPR-associated endoribonuclease Cas2 [Vibrio vulnificus]|uniref:type I-E CRISPR-associated endoribonuclease Cas2 n=1 Tax=Vibrio vulnificus TaxID=672 RepID=UPI003242A7EC
MNILVITTTPSARFKGLISRYLIKVDSNSYAGSVPKKLFLEFEKAAKGQNVTIVEFASKHSFGIKIHLFGDKVTDFTDIDGVLLPYRNRNKM